MNPAATRILDQLRTPDRIGRDLALLRTRLYRFSDDLRWCVLAETLEEHLLAGRQPQPATISAVRACLEQIRRNGSPSAFQATLAAAENIGITTALADRAAYMWQQVPLATPPSTVVIIVGAPRSGTSHLFNLLAATGKFAYLTTASCWAWPVRNLHQPGRHPFTEVGDAVLEVDNKRTRIIPGLIMPGEAEDIWHRAMPVYQHIRGHRYEISPEATTGDIRILQAAAHAHLACFRRTVLLAKSPFNSFRIPQIERVWGNIVRYIHIIRDQHEAADSMRRNHFEFTANGYLLTAELAWSRFVGSVHRHAPAGRTTTIRHEQLMNNPGHAVELIVDAVGVREPAGLPSQLSTRGSVVAVRPGWAARRRLRPDRQEHSMTLDPGTSAAGQLSSHLAACLSSDPAWDLALSRLTRGEAGLHLAVLTEPFCSLLLDGAKTIESRFSRVRCAPYGTLAKGDIVVVKKTGGPVTGAFQAGTVRSYHLTPARVAQLRDQYAAQICADDNQFWADRADCAYATLVDVTHVCLLPAQTFPKKDRRGWVQLTRPGRQETLL